MTYAVNTQSYNRLIIHSQPTQILNRDKYLRFEAKRPHSERPPFGKRLHVAYGCPTDTSCYMVTHIFVI